MPTFIKQTNNIKLKIFYISPDDWVYKPQYINYKKELGLDKNIYLLDVYHYGEKRNPHYRMKKFVSEICSDCLNIRGFPSFILFNKKNEIVYKKVGSVSFDTINDIMNKTKSP